MKQTEEFKKAVKNFKKVAKLSSLLSKSSTYIKVSGLEFNGAKDLDLTDLDVERLKKAVFKVNKATKELEVFFSAKSRRRTTEQVGQQV